MNRFLSKNTICFQYTTPLVDILSNWLWELRETEDISKIPLIAALLIRKLIDLPSDGAHMLLLGKSQLAIAESCRTVILNDLSKKFTLKEPADKFDVNVNTLNFYFK